MQPHQGGGRAGRRALLAAAATALAAPRPHAEEVWPSRPVRIVIPFAPGGPIDTIGRLLAEHLRERLGQPFVVENRSGAGGSIGLRAVVQSPPDGTSLVLTSSSLASLHALYPNQGLDPRRVVTPLSLVANVPTVMAVRADAPFHSVPEVIAAARAEPGRFTYGSGGVGSSNHLSGALFAHRAGIALTHVSYRGAAASMAALYAGEIDIVFASTVEALGHVRGGRARLLGVTTAERIAALPEVPAIAETVPGYVALNWYAFAGPRGLSPAMVRRFAATLAALREVEEVRARFTAAGTEALLTGPEALAERIAEDVPLWEGVVRAAGIRAE
ncbi:Bug family tripartite tricarboxylate transporter substrate binding protein [Crenalkalicoccus roseus]|uniref:Bug family tripartite tricarboxylate transporter substrate binding protein n=1 Tax=Crenalkalicoccus roseus TaxID=1485588 RepID=UPI00130537C8|nr:tripartite tricarboxylate transporter substrate-binding protein [Crenalkalicoccus roseus]